MVSQGTQKRSSGRMAKGQRSLLSSRGVLKLPQKMVHAVDQHHKEGQRRLALGRYSCEWAARRLKAAPAWSRHQVGKGRWGELTQQSAARARRVIDKQVESPGPVPVLASAA